MIDISPVYGDGPGVAMILARCETCRTRYAIARCYPLRGGGNDLDFIQTRESDTTRALWCLTLSNQMGVSGAAMWTEEENCNPICPECRTEFKAGQLAVTVSNGDVIEIPYLRDM